MEYLQEESLGQSMERIVWGVAEHQPCWQNIEGLKEQCRPTFLRIDPSDESVKLLNIELKTNNIIIHMKDRLDHDHKEAYDDQHLDGRKRHLAATTYVVAHKIARTPQQLQQRVAQRPRVHTPQNSYVIFDGFPAYAPHFGTLTADWAEVAAEIAVAVVAMLHLALMPVGIVRNGLLPVAETLEIFS